MAKKKTSFLKGLGIALCVIVGLGSLSRLLHNNEVKESDLLTVSVSEDYELVLTEEITELGESKKTTRFVGKGAGSTFRVQGDINSLILPAQGGTLIFEGLTFIDETTDSAGASYDLYLRFGGAVSFKNCTFEDPIYITGRAKSNFEDCTFTSPASNFYSVWIADGSARFSGCVFLGYRGLKIHEFADRAENVTRVSIYDCYFYRLHAKPGLAIGTFTTPEDVEIEIRNSRFFECCYWDRTGSLSGVDSFYETDTDLSTIQFKESGNVITYNDDLYWTKLY